MDLDKDILKEMGITVVGDIIAILKHAKDVYREVIIIFNCSLLNEEIINCAYLFEGILW